MKFYGQSMSVNDQIWESAGDAMRALFHELAAKVEMYEAANRDGYLLDLATVQTRRDPMTGQTTVAARTRRTT